MTHSDILSQFHELCHVYIALKLLFTIKQIYPSGPKVLNPLFNLHTPCPGLRSSPNFCFFYTLFLRFQGILPAITE